MDRDIKLAVIQTNFKEMISKGWFSVCDTEKAAELLGVDFTTEEKAFMNLLHCIQFADMEDKIKNELQKILEKTFSKEVFTIIVGKRVFGGTKTKLLTFVEKIE